MTERSDKREPERGVRLTTEVVRALPSQDREDDGVAAIVEGTRSKARSCRQFTTTPSESDGLGATKVPLSVQPSRAVAMQPPTGQRALSGV
jgi:hypothetical protein